MLPEDRLLGHYRLVRRIGSGGMGEVYLAEDTRIKRQVAIKVVRTEIEAYPDPVTMQDTVRLFQREMQAITTLDHPYILPLFDFGEERDGNSILTYMVTPLRQEGSLTDWLQKRGNTETLTPSEVAHFVMQAADALQHAHDHHFIHQDVKPSNFLVRSRPGNVLPDLLLMDFGIAKITTATATASQNIRGTPSFMAPEQWEGQPQPATDQYALAIMTYLLLTGRAPFTGGMEQVMRQHYMVPPLRPSSFNRAIPPALDAVILRALEKQPARRFPSIIEFAQAFQQALQSIGDQDPTFITPQNLPVGSAPLPSTPNVYSTIAYDSMPTVPASNPNLSMQPTIVTDPHISSPNWRMFTPLPPSLDPSVGQNVSSTKKSVWIFSSLVVLVILIILSTIVGVGLYQNHMNQVNSSAATSQVNDDAIATEQANETAIAQDYPSPAYPSYLSGDGTLAFLDPLNQESRSAWSSPGTNSTGGACQFTNGAYHVSQQWNNSFNRCPARGTFRNFALEVQLTIIQGDCGGIVFRDDGNGQFYSLSVCQDGTYYVSKYVSNSGKILSSHSNSAMNTRLGQQNKIAVVASGSSTTFYINGQRIDQKQDSSYTSGSIALIAAPYSSNGHATDVAYTNARLWTL